MIAKQSFASAHTCRFTSAKQNLVDYLPATCPWRKELCSAWTRRKGNSPSIHWWWCLPSRYRQAGLLLQLYRERLWSLKTEREIESKSPSQVSNVRALDFGARGDVFKSLWIFLSSKWHRMNPVQRVFIHVKIKYKILRAIFGRMHF